MINSGQISEDNCTSCMEDLFKRSNSISDAWELSKFNQKTYLSKKIVQPCSFKQDNMKVDEDFSGGTELVDDDSAAFSVSNSEELLTFEYNIIYSDSYFVPVMFFNVYRQDGSLLPLAQVWELVPDYYRERLASDKWTFLTQAEHPYLGRPFYQLHPCHTDKLMGAVSSVGKLPSVGSSNYLIGWLCAVGPVVLLNMPFEYGGLTRKQGETADKLLSKIDD